MLRCERDRRNYGRNQVFRQLVNRARCAAGCRKSKMSKELRRGETKCAMLFENYDSHSQCVSENKVAPE
jgi:hypothetical protein